MEKHRFFEITYIEAQEFEGFGYRFCSRFTVSGVDVLHDYENICVVGFVVKAYLLVRKLCRVHIKTRRNSRVARMRHDTISSSFDRNSTKFENKVISFLFLS